MHRLQTTNYLAKNYNSLKVAIYIISIFIRKSCKNSFSGSLATSLGHFVLNKIKVILLAVFNFEKPCFHVAMFFTLKMVGWATSSFIAYIYRFLIVIYILLFYTSGQLQLFKICQHS